ncbi:MAG: VWA domain-containing protein [Deltaproteobacteria bacterium]|nr:VWA domain-containing protein [Deltaproteobacteria bacterium]
MKTKNYLYRVIAASLLCIITMLPVFGSKLWAMDDIVPFFAGAEGNPNIMFIFDNSDSMQDVPYFRKDGRNVRPSGWRWRRGVKVDEDGTIAEDANGNIIYDYNAHTTQSAEVLIPGRTPPPMPRTDGGDPSLTSTVTKINRLKYWYLIYDENLDWAAVKANWNNGDYRYCRIEMQDPGGGNIQVRTIYGYSKSGKYWYVYRYDNHPSYNFDYSEGVAPDDDCYDEDSGWCGTYDNTNPFTYTIIAGQPGEVTFPYIPAEDHTGRYVRDANVDWSQMSDDYYNNTFRNRLLVVTAGTNKGESRRISWRSNSGKYWYVDPAFPENCDYTTRYKIVGTADDERRASGGNHPDSKMYQAKEALNKFLDSDKIKVCGDGGDEYLVNMGFATYMSARIPRVRARYYRKRVGATTVIPDRWRAYYTTRSNASDRYYYNAQGLNEFTITNLGKTAPEGQTDWSENYTYTNAEVGDLICRWYAEGNCNEQYIHYEITEIRNAPTDSLPNRKRFKLQSRVGGPPSNGGYDAYGWRYFDVADYPQCANLPENDNGWLKLSAGDTCYQECQFVPGSTTTTGDWYEKYQYKDTYGDYNVTDSSMPKYIDPDSNMVTPYKGYCNNSWDCPDCTPDPNPAEGNGDWTLVTETISDVPINPDGDTGDITPAIFDYSYFRYTGYSDNPDRPHSWSYRKTADDYIYRYAHSYLTTWGDTIEGQNSFPAEVGHEKANHSGDDQVVFVNLPEYDDDDADKGDDVSGENIAMIKNYVSLARKPYPYPGYENYDCTMMPYNTTSLAVNSSIAQAGKGTPLAASLEDAKEYYEDYFAQDQFTQGDCRKNYIILLTDGLETCDGDPVAAAAALNSPLIQDVPTSVVKTYVIGFGLDKNSRDNLNAIAAAGGTGHAYFATNVDELVDILTNEITSEIIGDSFTRSSPVISRIFDEGDELCLYHAYFDYPEWAGHLKKLNLEENGIIIGPDPEWTGACDDLEGNDADAGCEIKIYGRGDVYTTVDGISLTPFTSDHVSELKAMVNPDGDDINEDGNPGEDADAEAVIGYTRDPDYDNGKYIGNRKAGWPLGDIYHSVPVVIPEPKFYLPYWAGYEDDPGPPAAAGFKTDNAGRPTMIYTGANDGMLHAINDNNGQERWAYIPKCVLGTLHEFKEGHRFTVDLTIKGADIDTSDGCVGTGWKTMIVSGLRKGGASYYALDVTDPDNPLPVWEMTDNDATDSGDPGFSGADIEGKMGNTWSVPSFGRISIDDVPTSVVIVGGGYSTTENKGNRIYILRAATGKILKEIEVGGATNNIPAEIYTMRYRLNQNGEPVDYVTRTQVDPKLKGFIEVAYFGGTNGIFYKLTGLNADSGWNPQVEVLYAPPLADRQPIYHRASVADYACCAKRFVLFGTGDENDPTTVNQNYFYEIEDRAWDAELDATDYPDPSQGKDDGLFRLTWKEELDLGEEVLSDSFVHAGAVYFTTYQPQGGCDMGYSFLYGLTTSTCSDVGSDPALPGGNKKESLGKSISTAPVSGGTFMAIGDGDDVTIKPLPSVSGQLLYWREGQ